MPNLIRLPDNFDAFEEAREARDSLRNSWSHPAVYEARMVAYGSVSTFLRKARNPATREEAFVKFCAAYEGYVIKAVRRERMPGGAYQSEDNPMVKRATPSPPSDFETGHRNLAGLKDFLSQ